MRHKEIALMGVFGFVDLILVFYLTFRFKTFLEIIFKDGFSETCVLTVLHLLNPKTEDT